MGNLTLAMAEIIRPTLAEMSRRGVPFQGVLFAGLMIKDGQPRLVEYNVRFGDPECQVLMLRLGAQAMDLMHAAAEGRLSGYVLLALPVAAALAAAARRIERYMKCAQDIEWAISEEGQILVLQCRPLQQQEFEVKGPGPPEDIEASPLLAGAAAAAPPADPAAEGRAIAAAFSRISAAYFQCTWPSRVESLSWSSSPCSTMS